FRPVTVAARYPHPELGGTIVRDGGIALHSGSQTPAVWHRKPAAMCGTSPSHNRATPPRAKKKRPRASAGPRSVPGISLEREETLTSASRHPTPYGQALYVACRSGQNAEFRQSGTARLKFANSPAGLSSYSQMWNIQPPKRVVGVKARSGSCAIVGKSCSL